MRIALVMAGHGEGGLEKHVIELANGLERRGLQVSIIAHPMYGPRLAGTIQFLPLDLASYRRSPLALFRLFKAIRQTGADIVHAHGNKAASMVGTLLPFLRGVASAATLHSRKKNVRMFTRFDRVIAVSRISTENLRHGAIRIIHNGIAPQESSSSQAHTDAWPAPNDKPRALAIGRLVPVKGFDVLIEAWRGVDARLAIAGEGFERKRLEALIARTGQEGKIVLLGHRTDVAALLSAADIVVISSRYEGCPYVLIEALHLQVPVISTAVGAVPEILPEPATCAPESSAALSERIRWALSDPARTAALMAPAFGYACRELTFERLLDKTIDVYSELVPAAEPTLRKNGGRA